MEKRYSLTELAVKPPLGFDTIPFLSVYGEEAKIGHTSRKFKMGRAHALKAASQKMQMVTSLNLSAFMLQGVIDGTLKAVRSKSGNDVFLAFDGPKGKETVCRAYLENGIIRLSFQKIPADSHLPLFIPAAALAVSSNDACSFAYLDFVQKKTISTVYHFCDVVYYDFLQSCNTLAEVTDDLSMEMISQAMNSGYYEEFPYLKPPKVTKKPARRKQLKTEETEEKPKADIQSYRNGEHLVRHEWPEEQKKRIIPPDFLDSFVPIPEFFRLMNKLDVRIGQNMVAQYECSLTEPEDIRKDVVNVLLYGNPGTGKTVLAHALSAATGMPLYEVKFDKYTESDEVEGKNKIISGKLAFTETDFLEGYEKGGILLLEEINCADQNVVTGALNNAIEYPFFIMKDGYQKVSRNPFTVIIATMNVGTEGTMWLNQAFASRFKQKYRIADPSKEDFIRFLTNYGYEQDAAEYVHDAYTKVMNLLTSNRATAEYALNLSTRACLGALENMSEGDDAKTALTDTIVGAIGIVDPKAAEDIQKNVIANLPDFKKKGR